jgi:hypothetical protein
VLRKIKRCLSVLLLTFVDQQKLGEHLVSIVVPVDAVLEDEETVTRVLHGYNFSYPYPTRTEIFHPYPARTRIFVTRTLPVPVYLLPVPYPYP